ncbi:MAG: 16S rRNA (cytosine(1402)-N(4))-methyltransferase [Coprococcus sp.]
MYGKTAGHFETGGRVAILTFHSGEDKLVKKALKAGYREGVYSEYAKDVVHSSAEECAQNGRARSTKMRYCEGGVKVSVG